MTQKTSAPIRRALVAAEKGLLFAIYREGRGGKIIGPVFDGPKGVSAPSIFSLFYGRYLEAVPMDRQQWTDGRCARELKFTATGRALFDETLKGRDAAG